VAGMAPKAAQRMDRGAFTRGPASPGPWVDRRDKRGLTWRQGSSHVHALLTRPREKVSFGGKELRLWGCGALNGVFEGA